jgi:magnesium-transporting ATPase (P-type)
MSLLKSKNWFASLIITLCTGSLFSFLLAYMLKLYDKNAWYYKWQYWVFGALCLIFPVFIMLIVFNMQMLVKVSSKLEVPGEEIYNNPYFWIVCLIVPVIGWIICISFYIYLIFWIVVMLKKGKGEKLV